MPTSSNVRTKEQHDADILENGVRCEGNKSIFFRRLNKIVLTTDWVRESRDHRVKRHASWSKVSGSLLRVPLVFTSMRLTAVTKFDTRRREGRNYKHLMFFYRARPGHSIAAGGSRAAYGG